jgi:hypothetical protein
MERVYSSREPIKRAWLEAEMALVKITALMKLPATALPASTKTIVNGLEVVECFERPG